MNGPEPRHALAWHYHLQRGLYCRRQIDLGDAWLVADPTLGDPEWNHAALIYEVQQDDLPSLLADIEARLASVGRPPFLMLGPLTADLGRYLEALGWRQALIHDWVFDPPARPSAEAARPTREAFRVEKVESEAQMQSFIDVFFDGFGAVDGELDPGHEDALMQSFADPPKGIDVVHFLGLWQGRPIAVGTAIHGRREGSADGLDARFGAFRSASGFYNLAVRPEVRGWGLGEELHRWRLHQARLRGSELIFLQTASRRLAEWHQRHGWTVRFAVHGYERRS